MLQVRTASLDDTIRAARRFWRDPSDENWNTYREHIKVLGAEAKMLDYMSSDLGDLINAVIRLRKCARNETVYQAFELVGIAVVDGN